MRTCPELLASAMLSLAVAALLSIVTCFAQVVHAGAPRRGHPPGLPHYTHPRAPAERDIARARAWDVYDAIDEATADPRLRAELRRICRRESACNWIGTITWHEGDASGGRARWRAAVARGLLSPSTCDEHRLGDASRWTSYGAFGIAAAWTVRYAGACAGPSALDDPRVAARAAVRWIDSLCRRQRACTCEARVRWWVGPGVWAERSHWSRAGSIESQCGALPWWRWAAALALDGLAMIGVT